MRFDLSLTILLLQVLTSSGEQAFLSQPVYSSTALAELHGENTKYTLYDTDLTSVVDGSAGDWRGFYTPDENVYLARSILEWNEVLSIFGAVDDDQYIYFLYSDINDAPSRVLTENECPYGYISSIRVKSKNCQKKGGYFCGIEIECSKLDGTFETTKKVHDTGTGEWGSWIRAKGKFICGTQQRFNQDSIYGLKVMFCSIVTGSSYKINYYTVDRTKLYTYIEQGDWGYWQAPVEAREGYLGCAVSINGFIDSDKKDNGGAVQIVLRYCSISNWYDQRDVNLNQHTLNVDKLYRVGESCPAFTYITGLGVKYQQLQGSGDDTTLNGIEIKCSRLDRTGQNEYRRISHGLSLGDWRGRKDFDGQFVCGARVRYEDWVQGKDNTAVNGLKVKLCPVKY
jgi:hypothetical protein